jgi:hypothetical protein
MFCNLRRVSIELAARSEMPTATILQVDLNNLAESPVVVILWIPDQKDDLWSKVRSLNALVPKTVLPVYQELTKTVNVELLEEPSVLEPRTVKLPNNSVDRSSALIVNCANLMARIQVVNLYHHDPLLRDRASTVQANEQIGAFSQETVTLRGVHLCHCGLVGPLDPLRRSKGNTLAMKKM